MSGSGEISPRQRRVLDRLVTGDTISAAAAAENVSERQVYRWLRSDENFRSTMRQAQSLMLDAVGVKLVALAETAVSVLEVLMIDPIYKTDAPGRNIQLRAAETVLSICLRWKEMINFETRLEALEANMEDQMRSKYGR